MKILNKKYIYNKNLLNNIKEDLNISLEDLNIIFNNIKKELDNISLLNKTITVLLVGNKLKIKILKS